MPDIFIPDVTTMDGWFWLFSYLRFPASEDDRKSSMARFYSELMDIAEDVQAPGTFTEVPELFEASKAVISHELDEGFFRPLGGRRALLSNAAISGLYPNKSDLKGWRTAYFVISLALCVDRFHSQVSGGGSLKKAIFLMENFPTPGIFSSNSTYIRNDWNTYKSIAPLTAGILNVMSEDDFDFSDMNTFGRCLAIARSVQEALFSLTPQPGAGIALIDRATTWTVPIGMSLPNHDVDELLKPVPDKLLEILKEFRSPA